MTASRNRPDLRRWLRRLLLGVAVAGALAVPGEAAAQAWSAGLGLAGGLIAGAYVTTGTYVLKSRATGWVLHSVEDIVTARPEVLPLVAMPVAGALIGYRSPAKLGAAALWGGTGLLLGAAIGAGIGQLIWKDTTGRWAGATIGSAAGLAIGSILGAALKNDAPSQNGSVPVFTISLPLSFQP